MVGCVQQVGKFYETHGFDAIVLVHHLELNPMGKRVQAGFPLVNLSMMLERAHQRGFSVVVRAFLEYKHCTHTSLCAVTKSVWEMGAQDCIPVSPGGIRKKVEGNLKLSKGLGEMVHLELRN